MWSGGNLAAIPKAKADLKLIVAAFRPVMVSDSLCKSWYTWIRGMLIGKVEQFALDT